MSKLQGRILAVHGQSSVLHHDGRILRATLKKSLLKEKRQSSPLAAGDLVEFFLDSSGVAVIESVLPRSSSLSRPDILNKEKIQVIAANVDQLIIICSTDKPQFKPGLVDRYLVLAEKEKVKPVIVLNKIDLRNPAEFAGYLDVWKRIGYHICFTSAANGEGIEEVAKILRNKISVTTGHSGVGKTTLINSIIPELRLKTQEISRATGKGVHTTSAAIMYPLADGGWIIDTPGLKVLDISIVSEKELQDCFPEFDGLRERCQFGDCLHLSEPNCAVKRAVAEGGIAEFRYQSYQRFLREIADA